MFERGDAGLHFFLGVRFARFLRNQMSIWFQVAMRISDEIERHDSLPIVDGLRTLERELSPSQWDDKKRHE
jgi:hypothetical protein